MPRTPQLVDFDVKTYLLTLNFKSSYSDVLLADCSVGHVALIFSAVAAVLGGDGEHVFVADHRVEDTVVEPPGQVDLRIAVHLTREVDFLVELHSPPT